MARKTKKVEIEGKKYIISELDCLKARKLFVLMSESENKSKNQDEMMKLLFENIEMETESGALIPMDTEEVITQNLSLSGLLKLEKEATELTFGFLINGES